MGHSSAGASRSVCLKYPVGTETWASFKERKQRCQKVWKPKRDHDIHWGPGANVKAKEGGLHRDPKNHPSSRVQRKSGLLLQIIKLPPPQEPYLGDGIEAARVPVGTEQELPSLLSQQDSDLICHLLAWISLEQWVGHRGPAEGCHFSGQWLLEATAARRQTVGLLERRCCGRAWQLNSMKARSQWTLS